MKYYGQIGQDYFTIKCLKNKTNGNFLEIGSHDPAYINNTYKLEKEFGWKGIMVECNRNFLESYKKERPNSVHIMEDATKVDYYSILKNNNFPNNMDYLQIDLEVENSSTIDTLELLNNKVFDEYKFAVITFEHDIYKGNYFDTRERSRQIFEKRGYFRVFNDIKNGGNPFEDWYVHPELVDMEYINKIKSNESYEFTEIINRLDTL